MKDDAIPPANACNGDDGRDPWLLTPGPLSTSMRTKRAMLHDWGSWDSDFKAVTADIRRCLLALIGDAGEYDCVPMQGSGTYCIEAALASFIPRDGKALVLMNGAYGQRAARTLDYLGRDYTVLDKGDYLPPMPEEVDRILSADPSISDVVLIHCETSSGILNPLEGIFSVVERHGRRLILDSMSAFGAIPIDVRKMPVEVIVSSANKCIEGVPGFGFILARKSALQRAEGNSHSLSLDVHDQWRVMNATGQWRFTPPTHTVVAFREALLQHEEEGGIAGRLARYSRNRDVLIAGMREMGFRTLLDDRWLSPIITTFFCPDDENFTFPGFYEALKRRGFIIYPGKLTEAESFRIGTIGQVNETVMRNLLAAIAETIREAGIRNCAPAPGIEPAGTGHSDNSKSSAK